MIKSGYYSVRRQRDHRRSRRQRNRNVRLWALSAIALLVAGVCTSALAEDVAGEEFNLSFVHGAKTDGDGKTDDQADTSTPEEPAQDDSGEELNLNFIHGASPKNAPAILQGNTQYPPGQYIVDVYFNRQPMNRQVLTITPDDVKTLCLPESWISKAGLPLNVQVLKAAPGVWDAARQCFYLSRYPAGSVKFDYGSQSLTISEPQITLLDPHSAESWDFGVPGFKLSYSANVSKSGNSPAQYYGSLDLNANLGRWVLSGTTSGFSGQGFQSPQVVLSTPIAHLRANLQLGKTSTRSTLMPDFNFYGVSLTSDSSMVPWSARGYAPVISGVASSNARVTVSQGGYILSSQVVPPGAYSLKDISPIGNGVITVTVEEEDGTKTVRTYPVTTLPTLLRAGDFNYDLSVGMRNDDSTIKGLFLLGSLDYGFAPLTLNLATVLHRQYQGGGIGVTHDFGRFGALEASVNFSRGVFERPGSGHDESPHLPRNYQDIYLPAPPEEQWRYSGNSRLPNGGSQTGMSATIKYAKSLGSSTNLQLLSYRYTGKKYIDFADFDPTQVMQQEQRKERYEAMISQNLGRASLYLSAWTQSYRNIPHNDTGVNLSLSTSVLKGVSINFNGSYSKTHWSDNDWSLSLSMSVPFSLFGTQYYSNNSVNYSPAGHAQFNTSVSGSPTNNFNYNVSVGASRDGQNASLSAGYTFKRLQTSVSLTQYHSRGDSQTSGSASVSGAVMGTLKTGLLFTREQSDTVALLRIKNLPGITFNGSSPTNRRGVTAISLSPYSRNDISIDTQNLPDNVELLDSVESVVPVHQAIIYREFDYVNIKRYILRVLDASGQPLPTGTTAVTESGVPAGFVTQGGILLSSLISEPKSLALTLPDGKQCHVHMKDIKPGSNSATEVHCE